MYIYFKISHQIKQNDLSKKLLFHTVKSYIHSVFVLELKITVSLLMQVHINSCLKKRTLIFGD